MNSALALEIGLRGLSTWECRKISQYSRAVESAVIGKARSLSQNSRNMPQGDSNWNSTLVLEFETEYGN